MTRCASSENFMIALSCCEIFPSNVLMRAFVNRAESSIQRSPKDLAQLLLAVVILEKGKKEKKKKKGGGNSAQQSKKKKLIFQIGPSALRSRRRLRRLSKH